jgi:hypothetical protein
MSNEMPPGGARFKREMAKFETLLHAAGLLKESDGLNLTTCWTDHRANSIVHRPHELQKIK